MREIKFTDFKKLKGVWYLNIYSTKSGAPLDHVIPDVLKKKIDAIQQSRSNLLEKKKNLQNQL